MSKDLQECNSDRFPALAAISSASRLVLHPEQHTDPVREPDTEREYLATCQKIEQLLERKRRSQEESVDVSALHQELCLIGSRIQREPNDRSHEEDYASVLGRVKESLWRKTEAESLKGEFQKLHFELLTLGHKLGFERPQMPAPSATTLSIDRLDTSSVDDINLSDVERQLAQLQAQIRGLHDHR